MCSFVLYVPLRVFTVFRWARDTGRVKAKTAAESAEAALSTARDEARRERQAWESLRATLEEAAASREREAREVAEEKSREVCVCVRVYVCYFFFFL